MFLNYTHEGPPIYKVDETVENIRLNCSTDDEVAHGLWEGTKSLKKNILSVGEQFEIEFLQAIQVFVNVLWPNYALEQFWKEVLS